MSLFTNNGDIFTTVESRNFIEQLPASTFAVEFDSNFGRFYLRRNIDYTIDHKVYGNSHFLSSRILQTFESRSKSTGVLLSGEKGSGKTLLTKLLSIDGRSLGYPTLVINSPFCGDGFNSFIQSIEQPCIILFDEFEKVYDSLESQSKLLTLFDGTVSTRKLFLITVNSNEEITSYMKNRPGRIFYHIEYGGLTTEFIIEYCNDNLRDNSKMDGILRATTLFRAFNFDMLCALVEEMNRYDESATSSLKYLNINPEKYSNHCYKWNIECNGKRIIADGISLNRRSIDEECLSPFLVNELKIELCRYDNVQAHLRPISENDIQNHNVYHHNTSNGIVSFDEIYSIVESDTDNSIVKTNDSIQIIFDRDGISWCANDLSAIKYSKTIGEFEITLSFEKNVRVHRNWADALAF